MDLDRTTGVANPFNRRESSLSGLRALGEAAFDPFVAIDGAQRIVVINGLAEQLFGVTKDEVTGAKIGVLLPGYVRETEARHADRAMLMLEGRHRRNGPFAVDVHTSTIPRDDEGALSLILLRDSGAARAEMALVESENRFWRAFHDAAIGFALADVDGRYRTVNRAFAAMLGYDESELCGMSFQSVVDQRDAAATNALWRQLVAGEIDSFQREEQYRHRRGYPVWVMLAASMTRDARGAPGQLLTQITDISAVKEAERSLADYAAALERSNMDLEEFARAASHDLQEPLRAVASYATLLAERYGEQLDERGARWIGFITRGAERMKRQIDDLLSFSRVQIAGGRFAETDTAEGLRRTWLDLLTEEETGLHPSLTYAALPSIEADPAQLEQLWRNLLSNALKYRRPGVAPRIHVSAVRRVENADVLWWEFCVRDNGIGLDMANADRVFEIFQRLHREAEYEGTGIGLAICKRIVQRHGGRIWVESSPGAGASFRFRLPARHDR